MWFKDLTGFRETSGEEVRRLLRHDGQTLTSTVNGRSMQCGTLSTPSLAELRAAASLIDRDQESRLCEELGNIKSVHQDLVNAGALFQVASQFNLLEMVSPNVIPEQGVDIYEEDPTQGPACAMSCGAGTIFRNWFARVPGRKVGERGQTALHQIDCLSDLGQAWGNGGSELWEMKNGYVLATPEGLQRISKLVSSASERAEFLGKVRIGLQHQTEVTTAPSAHTVTQAYCSALPVGYSDQSQDDWEPFARFVLDAAYEATLLAAVVNAEQTGNNKVFLTLLGGGVFANNPVWIFDSILRAMNLHSRSGLDVRIVTYGYSNPAITQLVARYRSESK